MDLHVKACNVQYQTHKSNLLPEFPSKYLHFKCCQRNVPWQTCNLKSLTRSFSQVSTKHAWRDVFFLIKIPRCKGNNDLPFLLDQNPAVPSWPRPDDKRVEGCAVEQGGRRVPRRHLLLTPLRPDVRKAHRRNPRGKEAQENGHHRSVRYNFRCSAASHVKVRWS